MQALLLLLIFLGAICEAAVEPPLHDPDIETKKAIVEDCKTIYRNAVTATSYDDFSHVAETGIYDDFSHVAETGIKEIQERLKKLGLTIVSSDGYSPSYTLPEDLLSSVISQIDGRLEEDIDNFIKNETDPVKIYMHYPSTHATLCIKSFSPDNKDNKKTNKEKVTLYYEENQAENGKILGYRYYAQVDNHDLVRITKHAFKRLKQEMKKQQDQKAKQVRINPPPVPQPISQEFITEEESEITGGTESSAQQSTVSQTATTPSQLTATHNARKKRGFFKSISKAFKRIGNEISLSNLTLDDVEYKYRPKTSVIFTGLGQAIIGQAINSSIQNSDALNPEDEVYEYAEAYEIEYGLESAEEELE